MSAPNPSDLKYTASHEWVRTEADGSLTVGITDHAQEALGELVYVELPAVGRALEAGEACVVVESTKAASDVYAPISGKVVEVNAALADKPETINEALEHAPQTVNEAAFAGGWLFKLKPADPAAVAGLLSAADYTAQADS